MNQEATKKLFLGLLFSIIIGGVLLAIVSLTYSPIKELRNNNIESNAYANTSYDDSSLELDDNSSSQENILENIDITIDQSTGQDNASYYSVETELAKYTTTIYDTEEGRIHNIKLAISKLDGAIVRSNEEFSFNNTIGPMGKAQGYQKATGFNGNGRKIKIYGGGMCQISSTLYNAALIAKLEITERHPHSRRVYYVPQNKDASVSYGSADFKFKNTTSNDIKISASTDGHTVNIILYNIE